MIVSHTTRRRCLGSLVLRGVGAWYYNNDHFSLYKGVMVMLGARIAALRREMGQSQAELAKYLGVSASAVGMYEQGRREPSGAMLVALSENFGVSTDFLLTGKPNPTEETTIAQMLSSRLDAAQQRIGHRSNPLSGEELAVLLAAVLTNER